jgi:hypothetical protein
MLRRVAFVRTDILEERIYYQGDVHCSRILATLIIEAIRSSETSVLTRATQRNTPEDGSESLKSYIALTVWAL